MQKQIGGGAVNPNPFAVALGTPTVSLPSVCGQESEKTSRNGKCELAVSGREAT